MKIISRNDDLHELFLNVRKAYRLLYEYQNKILKLVKYIGDFYGYSYHGGWAQFSKPCPKNGKGSLNNWAWDWLNMYDYDFHFGIKKEKIKEGNENENEEIRFSIRLISDTGYYDSPREDKNKTKIETFADVENSKTKLILVASNKGWKFGELFNSFNSKEDEYYLKSEELNMYAKSYNLEAFIDEEATIEKLEDFREKCKENGINI